MTRTSLLKTASNSSPRPKPKPIMGGHRVSLDIYDATGPLGDPVPVQEAICAIAREQDLTVLSVTVPHRWDNGSYILFVVFEDSFAVVESWLPEKFVKIVVDLCHFRRNNTMRARHLANGIHNLFRSETSYIDRKPSNHGP